MTRYIVPILSVFVFIAAVQPVSARMYRWTDEEGNTHYSDRIPSEAIKGAHYTVNKRGLTTEHREAAKTEEEYARELELKRLQSEQEKELERQQAKDQVLLKSFRSEDDIILSRDGKLSTYDAQIRIVYDNIQRLNKRLAQQQEYAARLERQGKKPDKKTLRGIEMTQEEIKQNYESILRREHDKEKVEEKYAEDLKRFRRLAEIKNINKVRVKSTTITDHSNMLVETAIRCKDEEHCQRVWEKARAYGKANANTRVYTDSKRIFMTTPAAKSGDISITVSRIQPDKKDKDVIFMDVQCKKEIAHDTWCKTPEAQKIRDGFKVAVDQ